MLGLGVAAVGGVMQAMGQIKTGQLALYLLAAAAFSLYTPRCAPQGEKAGCR